ncbi:MAG: CBS domain-containing protein [Candidatus Nitrosotenuis sp.]|nr:CBS domain-containing protein [Candidatus Nitrosotenuis sp.]
MSTDVIHEHMQQVMKTKIGTIVSRPVLIDPSMSAAQVISKLSKADVFDAFCRVKNSTMNVNIRDLLQSRNILHATLESLLHQVPSLSENDTVGKAVDIITNNRTRAAPVVKNGEIVGVVQAKDILKLISELDNRWIKVNQIFTANPLVADRQTPLSTARKIMVNNKIDHLPITNKNAISNVLTSYHLLQSILPQERVGRKDYGSKVTHSLESPIGNMGTSRIPVCEPLDNLNEVISSMLHANTTFCLVSLRTGLQGIVTYRDILGLLASRVKSTVPLFVIGLTNEDNAAIITDKFRKTLDKLSRVYSDIQEARVSVKKIHGNESRYNYEVSAVVLTPTKRHIFARSGYDLSKVFDEISGRMMRGLAKRAKRRNKISIRKMA